MISTRILYICKIALNKSLNETLCVINQYKEANDAYKTAKRQLQKALKEIGAPVKNRDAHAYNAFHTHYRAIMSCEHNGMYRMQCDEWLNKNHTLVTNEMHYRAYKKKMYDRLMNRVARIIQAAWFCAITNPEYAICKKRLMTEFQNM